MKRYGHYIYREHNLAAITFPRKQYLCLQSSCIKTQFLVFKRLGWVWTRTVLDFARLQIRFNVNIYIFFYTLFVDGTVTLRLWSWQMEEIRLSWGTYNPTGKEWQWFIKAECQLPEVGRSYCFATLKSWL